MYRYQEMVARTKGMNQDVCRLVLKEYKISCAEVILRDDITVDQFIDVIEGNRAYIPVLYVFNKIDSLTIEELDILDQMPNYVPISSAREWNLEELMQEIWEYVYQKKKTHTMIMYFISTFSYCHYTHNFINSFDFEKKNYSWYVEYIYILSIHWNYYCNFCV